MESDDGEDMLVGRLWHGIGTLIRGGAVVTGTAACRDLEGKERRDPSMRMSCLQRFS